MGKKQSVKVLVKGRVQGVGYRAFVEREATRLGLRGFCKNLVDGSVQIELEGDRGCIDQLIQKLWVGPSLSNVQDVSIEWKNSPLGFPDFSIRF